MIRVEETKDKEKKKKSNASMHSVRVVTVSRDGIYKRRFPFLISNMGFKPTVLRHLAHVSV